MCCRLDDRLPPNPHDASVLQGLADPDSFAFGSLATWRMPFFPATSKYQSTKSAFGTAIAGAISVWSARADSVSSEAQGVGPWTG